MNTNSPRLPGFNAEAALGRTSTRYRQAAIHRAGDGGVAPQFSMRAFVCGALVAAILAGQEELIPVLATYGCYGDA
jgi:hypothetical protein